MTSIYDDVNYIELLNTMAQNEDNQIHNKIDNKCHYEKSDEVIKLFEYINQKKMFEKLLKKTLKKLNKTNPALESAKYHILCLHANRYNRFIIRIEYNILIYEWKKMRNMRKDYKKWDWEWSWKLMTYFKKSPEIFIHYKNDINKKND
ncbi:MAG: hypothetical protein WD512_05250 [Candidatus Paceibacterota bacterium]